MKSTISPPPRDKTRLQRGRPRSPYCTVITTLRLSDKISGEIRTISAQDEQSISETTRQLLREALNARKQTQNTAAQTEQYA